MFLNALYGLRNPHVFLCKNCKNWLKDYNREKNLNVTFQPFEKLKR